MMKISWVIGGVLFVAITFGVTLVARNWTNIQTMTLSPEERIAQARKNKEAGLIARSKELGLNYPPPRLFLRALKQEKELEVWAANSGGKWTLFRTYPVAGQSGGPGPKRREGDRQVPEGVYKIDRFNPKSKFYLSLGIDYPNASDRKRSDPDKPGGDIFIHGDTRSIGCLAMTDDKIEEIYLLAMGARQNGIPVHIFPCRMEGPTFEALKKANPQHADFWAELLPIYQAFEKTKSIPSTKVTTSGAYQLKTNAG